jgi:hypothetical protein
MDERAAAPLRDWPRRSSAGLSRGVSLLTIRKMSLTQHPWADQIAADIGAEELRRTLVSRANDMVAAPRLLSAVRRLAACRRSGANIQPIGLLLVVVAYPQPNG